jgi:hypothetical protein
LAVSSVAVTGTSPLLPLTKELQLRAIVTYSDASETDQTNAATWGTSNASVAGVSSAGLVTAEGLGSAEIRAIYKGVQGTFSLTVEPLRIEFSAVSAGALNNTRDLGFGMFTRDGESFYFKSGGAGGGRGIAVAHVDLSTGELVGAVQTFDTWSTQSTGAEMSALIAHLDAIPDGALVLVAVGDEAGLNRGFSCASNGFPWTSDGIRALEALGAQRIADYCFRDSWSLIAITGSGAVAEGLASGVEVTASYTLEINEAQ